MGKTEGSEKNGGATKVEKEDKKHEKKGKHADMDDEKEAGTGKEKAAKDKKKKKDKDGKDKEDGTGKDQKKKKNPQDKADPAKLKQKLENIDAKMQALVTRREEILKLLNEVEKNAANPNGGACPF